MAVQLCCVFGKSGDGWQCVWVTAQLASACWWVEMTLSSCSECLLWLMPNP